MALSTVAKAGAAISGSVGVPAAAVGTYLYANSLYEVEKKVIDEKVGLEVSGETANQKVVKVKTVASASAQPASSTTWNESNGYWWECTIISPASVTLNKTTWQGKLFKDETDATNKVEKLNGNKELVQKCSKGRKEANSHKVKSILDFSKSSDIKTENDLLKFFFGE